MRAAFFDGIRSLTVREAPVPEPSDGHVRLRVSACGICGSDLTVYKTGVLSGPEVILGHEVSAVVDLDPSERWAPGARVTFYPTPGGCGQCVWCLEGRVRYCTNPPPQPLDRGGGFAEFVVVTAESLIRIPDEVEDRKSTL